jgi:hypothetical protein
MEYVSEDRFIELLNQALADDARGAYLQPFIHCAHGFDWPRDDPKVQNVYYLVLNQVREKYGIYH